MTPGLQNQGPLPPAPSSKPGVTLGAPLPGRSSWCCGEQRPPSRCARLLWALGPSQEPLQTGAIVTLPKMRKLRLRLGKLPRPDGDKLGSAWLQILCWGQCHKAQSPAAPLDSVPGCAQATLHCSDTR